MSSRLDLMDEYETLVEFVEHSELGPTVAPTDVLINGSRVRVEDGSIAIKRLNARGDSALGIRLTLLPDEVRIRRVE